MTHGLETPPQTEFIRSFGVLSLNDVLFAGGKGANLGELTRAGIAVPPGFVVGASAYAAFCDTGGLRPRLTELLATVDHNNVSALGLAAENAHSMVMREPAPTWLERLIRQAYEDMCAAEGAVPVAVRSSATSEDSAEASYAGMHDSFLNVRGSDAVVDAVRGCWASLFGARSIFYRATRGERPAETDIAVVVQRQIEAGRAGVMFTADPATGRRDRIVIEATFGLGEPVVLGRVTPDRYVVDKANVEIVSSKINQKDSVVTCGPEGTVERELTAEQGSAPTLDDDEVRQLAELGIAVEDHYGAPQDTEWAFDASDALWMLQSRPITERAAGQQAVEADQPEREAIVSGLGASPGIGSGRVKVVSGPSEAAAIEDGDVLVASMTAPDWVQLMRKASAIVTDSGGMTCHAAIVARELGIPAVVGTSDATSKLSPGQLVTVDGSRGEVSAGVPDPSLHGPRLPVSAAPMASRQQPLVTGTLVMLNLSEPSLATGAAELPSDGVGLLRAELMLLEALDGVHPRVLLERGEGEQLTERLAAGIQAFTSAFAPRPVTYRTMDFRTNEFRGLDGGERFEAVESNPMIGYRGAARYLREPDLFRVELEAIKQVILQGALNVRLMLPFVRSADEFAACVRLIDGSGLLQLPEFELWAMAEVPSIYFNLEAMASARLAGISIGSNDLTQLLLGVDRDSELLAQRFDERDPAVERYIVALIKKAKALGLKTSICGQAPSVHPEYATLLVDAGIDSVSVSVDALLRARELIASAEQRLILAASRARAASEPRDMNTNQIGAGNE